MKEQGQFRQGLNNSFRALSDLRHLQQFSGSEIAYRYGDRIRRSFETDGSLPVLICARDELEDLPRLLFSLSRQTCPVSPLVVDNNSSDGTGELARSLGAKVIEEKEKGLINALRRGFTFFSELKFPPLCILHTDADCYPVSSWAQHLTKKKRSSLKGIGEQIFGPVVHYGSCPKDGLRTIIAFTIDSGLRCRGFIRPKGPNGAMFLDNQFLMLKALTYLDLNCVTGTDQLVNDVLTKIGVVSSYNWSLKNLVFSKGDRYSATKDIFLTFLNPRYREILYADWFEGREGGVNYRSRYNPRKRL